jgi:hypothetical protein
VKHVNGITHDPVVRATEHCNMRCYVDSDELRFEFDNTVDNGLQLAVDWQSFVRCMRAASLVIERLHAIPAGAPIDFEVTVDDNDQADIIAALRMPLDIGSEWIPATCRSLPTSPTGAGPDEAEEHVSTSIAAYPYVTVMGTCTLICRVQPDQVEFRFGDTNSGLQFFLNFRGLAKFMRVASKAVKKLRSIPDSARIDFKVRDDEDSNERLTRDG